MTRTCFVISPIGEEGSDTRRRADDLYDLLIGPALEPFRFELVRADRIPGSGVITNEIIELVQNAELCVIDLSDHNANVYYECGRRHETGKPYVQLIRRDDSIPFDLAGIRTISYDLATPRGVYEATQTLRRFVEEYLRTGFQPTQAGASMATLATGLERLERKIDRLNLGQLSGTATNTGQSFEPKQFAKDPRLALAEAIAVQDFDYAANVLPAAERRSKSLDELIMPAAILANEGYEIGASLLERALDGQISGIGVDTTKAALAAYVTFRNITDSEEAGIAVVRDVVERAIEEWELSGCDEAYFINQLQRALPTPEADDEEDRYAQEALELIQRATQLCPDEPAYWFNLSVNNERAGLDELAVTAIDRCLALSDPPSSSYLFQAVDVYAKAGRDADARSTFDALRGVSPPRAQLMLANPVVARAIQGEASTET